MDNDQVNLENTKKLYLVYLYWLNLVQDEHKLVDMFMGMGGNPVGRDYINFKRRIHNEMTFAYQIYQQSLIHFRGV